jgi:hypothetical protein
VATVALPGALNACAECATVGVKEVRAMSNPSSNPGQPEQTDTACGRPLSVAELLVVLEELDRVVGELEESLVELALPFDEASRGAAWAAIANASGH